MPGVSIEADGGSGEEWDTGGRQWRQEEEEKGEEEEVEGRRYEKEELESKQHKSHNQIFY